jgi:hypothetical protein
MNSDDYNYVVPGIFDRKEDPETWDWQARLWLHDHCYGHGSGFNYRAGIAGGTLKLTPFATIVGGDLTAAQLFPVRRYVGHSNACRMFCRALELFPQLVVSEAHLIAAAVGENCELEVGEFGCGGGNGLNAAVARGQIRKLVLYVSSADEILWLPGISYGKLGRDGPMKMSPALAEIVTIVRRSCGHSEWVSQNFEETMQLIVKGEPS